jgi:CheY-like chemotaxis protein
MKNSNKKNILLIDDDIFMHQLVKEYLKKTNFNLISSLSGQDGLTKVKEDKIDLVLLDINMPVMDGYEVLYRIKEINPEMDVVMCTGDDRYNEISFNSGAIAYLMKPISNEKLLKIIDFVFKLQMVV